MLFFLRASRLLKFYYYISLALHIYINTYEKSENDYVGKLIDRAST